MLLEILGQLKNPMTSSGIEPATFSLVAQWKNVKVLEVHFLVGGRNDLSKAFTAYNWSPDAKVGMVRIRSLKFVSVLPTNSFPTLSGTQLFPLQNPRG
jgi:hypothetical protein